MSHGRGSRPCSALRSKTSLSACLVHNVTHTLQGTFHSRAIVLTLQLATTTQGSALQFSFPCRATLIFARCWPCRQHPPRNGLVPGWGP